MGDKATLLEKRYTKMCDICMLVDADAKDMKWHLYKEAFYNDEPHYVCDGCVKGLQEVRRKCNQKIDNPNHDIFKDFIPWFAKEVPGLVEAFRKQMS